MELNLFLVAASICLAGYLISSLYRWFIDPVRRIPGPTCLPLLGAALAMDIRKPHLSISEWADRYGPLIRIKLLGQMWVIASSYELVYDMLVRRSQEFSGRPQTFRASLVFEHDILFAEGDTYMRRKKLFIQTMKNYGSGLYGMEKLLSKSTADFIQHLKSRAGEKVNIAEEFFLFICQVIAQLLYGGDFDLRDPAVLGVQTLMKRFFDFISLNKGPAELDSFPWLMGVPLLNKRYQNRLQEVQDLKELVLRTPIRQAMDEYDDMASEGNGQSGGMIKQLVLAMRSEHYSDGTPKFTAADIEGICMNVIGGGIETTRRTITQIVLELWNQPKIVDRLREELDLVVGRHDPPKLSNRSQMPFAESIIDETNRILAFSPLLMHKATQDVELSGYRIPKDTWVLANIWPIQHDQDVYPDPYCFNPGRYLDKHQNRISRDDPKLKRILVFGGGRRACPGEEFAKARLFLLVTSLYQNLDLTLVEDINCDVRSYQNESLLKVPETVMARVSLRPH